MAQIHKNLVIGLDWGTFESIKAAKSSVPRPSPWIARLSNEAECVQAFVSEESGAKKYMAGAVILASTGSSAAIFQHIDEDHVWVCAAANGLPLIGFDLILPKSDAYHHLQSIEDSLGRIAIYGDGPGSVGSIDDLIDVTSNKALKAAHLFKESRSPIILTAGALAVVLAVGGSYYYISSKEKERAEQEMMIAAQMAAAQAAEQAKKALDAHLMTAKAAFNTYQSMGPLVESWLDVFKSLPLSQNGWRPDELSCQPSDCKVVWKRDKSALVSSYDSLPGESHELTNNDQATSLIKIDNQSQPATGVLPKTVLTYLRDVALNTTTTAYGFSYTEPAPYLSGVPEGQDLSLQSTLGGEGTFKITSSSTLNLMVAMSKLPLKGFYASDMKFAAITPLRDTYTIELNGRYRASE